MTTVLTAANEDAGTRLDAFLAARLPELSRSRAASLVQEGRVTVNGRPASKSCRLTGGETLSVDLPEQPVEITADGTRLYRVFQNLLQNALNYSLPGSRVYLSLKTTDKAAVASIRNTSRNELPEGVDFTARFVRGDESRTDGGTGLGLSVAKSFTEACGGTFRVETMADLFTAIVSFPVSMHEPKR